MIISEKKSGLRLCVIASVFLFLFSCQNQSKKGSTAVTDPKAQAIIDTAIIRGGFPVLDYASVNFDFRDKHYKYKRDGDLYEYQRIFTEENGDAVRDLVQNQELTRYVNGKAISLTTKRSKAFWNSINSVMYFAFLPYKLNDKAVIKEYLGETDLRGKNYHKIRVSFKAEGGGKDFDDVFIYWFDTSEYRMDYLAYTYHTDGGGTRFREAFNPRRIQGIHIQDFKNLKPKRKGSIKLEDIDQAWQQDKLEFLSNIEIENVQIKLSQDQIANQ